MFSLWFQNIIWALNFLNLEASNRRTAFSYVLDTHISKADTGVCSVDGLQENGQCGDEPRVHHEEYLAFAIIEDTELLAVSMDDLVDRGFLDPFAAYPPSCTLGFVAGPELNGEIDEQLIGQIKHLANAFGQRLTPMMAVTFIETLPVADNLYNDEDRRIPSKVSKLNDLLWPMAVPRDTIHDSVQELRLLEVEEFPNGRTAKRRLRLSIILAKETNTYTEAPKGRVQK
ncbi:MAG: hypothetical protein LQ340_003448 [Diploschistes diacapsis]|nr:MAG: hypothetical protein LQ340_003448 [Diploschistes diacapsis]